MKPSRTIGVTNVRSTKNNYSQWQDAGFGVNRRCDRINGRIENIRFMEIAPCTGIPINTAFGDALDSGALDDIGQW